MTVPLLYGGMYLWANQNPYAKLDHIPAAIVNTDAGTTDSTATTVNYGDKVDRTDRRRRATSTGTSSRQAQAAAGLRDETYDFVFTIPTRFSTT